MSLPAPDPIVRWDAHGTPHSPRFSDIYRSQGLDGQGGLAQCRHVFLRGCGLLGPAPLWQGRPHWTVLETGFGLGLNFLATWAAWRADPQRPRHLHFVSVEAFPVTADDLRRSVAPWPELQPLAEALAVGWWGLLEGVHRLTLDNGQVHLTLGIGPAEQRLSQLHLQADSVYLDGFSPEVNPELWSPQVLSLVADHCRVGTRLSTWSVARTVRDTLVGLGFVVDRVPGLPPKRHALTACYRPETLDGAPPSPTATSAKPRCAVVGAGLAGAAVARALAERGWSVDVFESGPCASAGASGLPAGLCAPHVSQDDSWLSRLTRAGLRTTAQQVRRLLQAGQDYGNSGVLERRLPHKARKARLPALWPSAGHEWSGEADLQTCLDSFRMEAWPADESPALWHPRAFWLKPARLVLAQLSHAHIQLHLNSPVQTLRMEAPGHAWTLGTPHGHAGPFDQVVLCAGPSTLALLQQTLPPERCPALNPVRGQLSWGRVNDSLARVLPTSPVNGDGSFLGNIPDEGGLQWMAGSSFDRSLQAPILDERDHHDNLGRLRGLMPAVAMELERQYAEGAVQGWAGVRCTTPDRLPRVGPVAPDLAPTLHVLTGLGARGLTLSVLCGQWLAARICQEPWPIEPELAQRLTADRP